MVGSSRKKRKYMDRLPNWSLSYSKVYFLACCFFFLLCFCGCNDDDKIPPTPVEEFDEIRVMTYNVLYSTSNEQTLKVLRETDADIIGLQEISAARLMDLAQKLGYRYHRFSRTSANLSDDDTGILSRFPITVGLTNGVLIQVNHLLEVAVFTVHLSPYPYEPYDFRDGKIATAAQAIASASSLRLPEIQPVIAEIDRTLKAGHPVFLTGDFNEPSFLDWTATTAANNLHFGKQVEWPVSKQIVEAGLTDVYRFQFPDPADFPGNTWTTIESPDEVYDRIDIIYQNETEEFTLTDIRTVGGGDDAAGIPVEDYPSDHYAVIATYKLK
jgi:exodeoxyribonuclease-3